MGRSSRAPAYGKSDIGVTLVASGWFVRLQASELAGASAFSRFRSTAELPT
jgi:hypothetical protein